MREYETTFIIQPEISEDGVQSLCERLDAVLSKNEAIRLVYDDLGRRRLAYEIRNFQKGRYLTLMYLDGGEVVPEIERALRLDDSVLRFLTVQVSDDVKDIEARKAQAAELERVRAQKAAERAAREAEEAERAAREAEEAERERAARKAKEAEQAAPEAEPAEGAPDEGAAEGSAAPEAETAAEEASPSDAGEGDEKTGGDETGEESSRKGDQEED